MNSVNKYHRFEQVLDLLFCLVEKFRVSRSCVLMEIDWWSNDSVMFFSLEFLLLICTELQITLLSIGILTKAYRKFVHLNWKWTWDYNDLGTRLAIEWTCERIFVKHCKLVDSCAPIREFLKWHAETQYSPTVIIDSTISWIRAINWRTKMVMDATFVRGRA